MLSLLLSGCVWVGINHTGDGVLPLHKTVRTRLVILSCVLQLVFCVLAIPGIVIVGREAVNNIENLEQELNQMEKENFVHNLNPNFSRYDNEDYRRISEKRLSLSSGINYSYGTLVLFCCGNSVYTIIMAIFMIITVWHLFTHQIEQDKVRKTKKMVRYS